jgi:tripeptide aminopeptidase
MKNVPLDEIAAEAHLVNLLSVEGITGEEKAIAEAVATALQKVGVPAAAIRFDNAHEKIPVPTQTGNLIVELPGTRKGDRLLFSSHLDTVPLCAGAKPIRQGDRIVTDGSTALGGDARTGCAAIVAMVETLLKHKLPHPPLTLLFTVREESGLHGSRELDAQDLGGAKMCFNVDSTHANKLTIAAVGQENWEVAIKGKASHAGVAPEKGISATLVGSIALAEAHRAGWFGKVTKPEGAGTSNVGVFGGKEGKAAGDATNVVTDYVHITGEARSHDPAFAGTIVAGYREAFKKAQAAVNNSDGETAEVTFDAKPAYPPFKLDENSPAVHLPGARSSRSGWRPRSSARTAASMPTGWSSTAFPP